MSDTEPHIRITIPAGSRAFVRVEEERHKNDGDFVNHVHSVEEWKVGSPDADSEKIIAIPAVGCITIAQIEADG
jgi:hypothetical protein